MIVLNKFFENEFLQAPISGVPIVVTSPQIKLVKSKKRKKMIGLNETYSIITEGDRLDISRDTASISNKIKIKPKGILISDSYNNPFFPIRPRPRIDTSKVNLIEVFKRYREKYSKFNSLLLPWHFCVEIVEDKYMVFNTRPIDLKFPITNIELKQQQHPEWDELTELFFKENIFDVSEAIHILIIGDSNLDIYTKHMYEIIGRTCIAPFIRYFRLPEGIFQRTFPLNIGRKFNMDLLTKFIKR